MRLISCTNRSITKHCIRLQHTAATHCNHWVCHSRHVSSLMRKQVHCNTLQYTATHCSNALQHMSESWQTCVSSHAQTGPLQHTATHCCNTLQRMIESYQTCISSYTQIGHGTRMSRLCHTYKWREGGGVGVKPVTPRPLAHMSPAATLASTCPARVSHIEHISNLRGKNECFTPRV